MILRDIEWLFGVNAYAENVSLSRVVWFTDRLC